MYLHSKVGVNQCIQQFVHCLVLPDKRMIFDEQIANVRKGIRAIAQHFSLRPFNIQLKEVDRLR